MEPRHKGRVARDQLSVAFISCPPSGMIAFGMVIGIAVGSLIGGVIDHLSVGIGFGIGLGLAAALAIDHFRKGRGTPS